MLTRVLLPILVTLSLVFPYQIQARTTPEDILNAKKATYNQKVASYSATHKQQLTDLSNKIALVNAKLTEELQANVERQGEILNEYQYRMGNFDPTSNVARPTGVAIDDAHYWLTYAHEAVAFQAAKVYVFNLTSESNIKNDASGLISNLQSDISILQNKVAKSQKLIQNIVKGE